MAMAIWFFTFLSLLICLTLKLLLPNATILARKENSNSFHLPPGPPRLPLLGNLHLLSKSLINAEPLNFGPLLRRLRSRYGPIFTFYVGPRLNIFITDQNLAHQALIQNSIAFADRPPSTEVGRIIRSDQHNITLSTYGSLWRLLRRNLTSEILHPSRIKSFSQGREWALRLLIDSLNKSKGGDVCVIQYFRYTMFSLVLLVCFGQKLDEKTVHAIEDVERRMLMNAYKYNVFTFFPRVGKILFHKLWNELLDMRRQQEELLIPLIRARAFQAENQKEFLFSYVDSLFNLELPKNGGSTKLKEGEIVSLCAEFLDGGTDTTATALQWIMANLVKHQEIQARLYQEIETVKGNDEEIVKEEEIQRMPYLKAVILEGLRRHPPSHFVIPHGMSEDVILNGHLIPKNSTVNFTIGDIGLDGKVWEDPLEFKPERFLEGEIDITGTKEIKMMPFGVGRRICPAFGLAILHLEFFVGNLVREFEWKTKEGEEVDMSEKSEFTVVMRNPLKAVIVQRRNRSVG